MSKRIAFVTIGQTPRDDVLPDIIAESRTVFTATERGVLDDLSDAEIADLAPRPGEAILASRLRDGRGVVLGKPAVEIRLRGLIAELDALDFDLIVLLCTGAFGRFAVRTRFLEPGHLVDHFLLGLGHGAQSLGVLLPEPEQAADFSGFPGIVTMTACASPYVGQPLPALREAGLALSGADMIVTHCIGYSEIMRQEVARASGRPVLLARRLIAHAIDLLLT